MSKKVKPATCSKCKTKRECGVFKQIDNLFTPAHAHRGNFIADIHRVTAKHCGFFQKG